MPAYFGGNGPRDGRIEGPRLGGRVEQANSANDAGLHIERKGTSAAREGGSGGDQVGGGQQVRRGLVFVGQVLAAGDLTTGALYGAIYEAIYERYGTVCANSDILE